MTRLLRALLFGSWIWAVEVTAAPIVLESPRSAQLVIPADGSRDEQAHGGVAPRPSSGTDAALTPASRPSESRQPAVTLEVARSVHSASRPALQGVATWYATPGLTGAAGPALRRALGHWRGQWVRVCADRCVVVKLTDWCACGARGGRPTLVDLSDRAFAAIAPLVAGVVQVTVKPVRVAPPETDR